MKMEISTLKQTKCLPNQYAIHVHHGWCLVVAMDGMQRTCMVEDDTNSFEFVSDVRDLKAVDPRRDLMPTQSAKVMALSH